MSAGGHRSGVVFFCINFHLMSAIKITLNAVASRHARQLNIKNMAVYSVGRCGFLGRDKYIWMFHTLLSAPEVLQKLTFVSSCLKVKNL